mmetsp:Transcript_1282/g.1130  ORF Transcript_1282/g.1130 Transcript_1282/m.1130 type:complete len:80 (-) Transcript_1282:460-699(-)
MEIIVYYKNREFTKHTIIKSLVNCKELLDDIESFLIDEYVSLVWTVQLLIKHCANVSTGNCYCNTALPEAVREGHTEKN